MRYFLMGEMYWLSFRLSETWTELEIIALGLMNIAQWNLVFNRFSSSVFSGVFCTGILFMILTHMLLKTSYMLWCKALKLDHFQVHI